MKITKKIAVVIAAALTNIAFVAAPSHAVPTISNTVMYDTTNGVQVVNGFATLTLSTDTSTVTNVVVSGAGSVVIASAGTNTSISIPVQTNGWYQITNNSTGAGVSTVTLTSAVVGTTTITATPILSNGTQGTPVVKTITWTSTGSLLPSTAYTTVYSASGSTAPTSTTNAVAIVSPLTANLIAGNIKVDLRDGNNVAISNGTLTATVSGPGLIGIGATQAAATVAGRAVTGASGAYYINVFGDGTPGTSTITISSGTTILATKTFVFSGVASSYSAVNASSIYKVGANASAIAVTVKDVNGNLVADGTTVYATSDATSVATVASSAVTVSGIATFAVQGIATGTANITFANDPTTPTIATKSVVKVGSSTIASVGLAFDKSAYVNGEAIKLTLTAKDASGLAVADGTYANVLSADLISSTQLGGATLVGSASPTFVNGVATWNVYAPLSAGTFSVNGVFALTKAAITTSASVADPNATALSTLIASIQSLNDKLTAQITALNAQVASLQAQLTASQATATAAAAQAKADYNKLATAWNKAHPTKKVALKK